MIHSFSDATIVRFSRKMLDAPEQNNMGLHVARCQEDVIANRRNFLQSFGYTLDDLVCAEQTHSAVVHKVTAADRGAGSTQYETGIPVADALYTRESDIVLGTFVADCIPVVLWDPVQQIIGVVHSGWQGTVKEIVRVMIQTLVRNEQCDPSTLQLWLGPSLSERRFEVDRDVYEQFFDLPYARPFIRWNEQTNKWHIDTKAVVREQALQEGVLRKHLSIDATCTFDAIDGFSYREDRSCGRHLATIVRPSN